MHHLIPIKMMLPRSNHSQQGLTLLRHGSQHAFSRNPIFPLPPFFTHLNVQKRLWSGLGAFCPEVREGGREGGRMISQPKQAVSQRFELWRTSSCAKWDLGHLGKAHVLASKFWQCFKTKPISSLLQLCSASYPGRCGLTGLQLLLNSAVWGA